MPDAQTLLRLLTLSSANLPVGAYCYSQGLESAMENGLIHDEASTLAILRDVLELSLAANELVWLKHLLAADDSNFATLAAQYDAGRDTRENRLESRQMGKALATWQAGLTHQPVRKKTHGYLPEYARLCRDYAIGFSDAATAYAFAQLENGVLATVKTLPLGQMAGQRILWALHEDILATVANLSENTHPPSGNLPGLAGLQVRHESQYSRLFRS